MTHSILYFFIPALFLAVAAPQKASASGVIGFPLLQWPDKDAFPAPGLPEKPSPDTKPEDGK